MPATDQGKQITDHRWLRFAVVCLVLSVCLALYSFLGDHHLPGGVLIGIMGLVAAGITFRDRPPKAEQRVWIFFMTLLLVSEIANLYAADAKQSEKLNAIAGRLATTASAINTAVNNITGGDSITYLAVKMTKSPPFQLEVCVVGQFSVSNVAAEMQSLNGAPGISSPVNLGRDWFGTGITPIPDVIRQPGRYVARILARNGDITEQIDVRQCSDGSWSQAIKMNGAGAKENEKLSGRPGCNKPFD